jgi:hypothetical protein
MKKLFALFISSILALYCVAQSAATLTDINNNSITIESLAGKKIIITILPLQEDSSVVNQLVRFQNKFGDSVKIIGLVCLSACNASSQAIGAI